MKKWLWGMLSVPLLLVLWSIASIFYDPLVLPGPTIVYSELIKQLASLEYYHHIGISLYRLFAGFILAMLAALSVGLIAGLSQSFRYFLTPIVSFFQATPPMAWAPLLFLIFALGNAPMIAIIFIAAFFPILVNVIHGIERIQISHIRAALSLGANRQQLIRYVYLPGMMPAAFTGLIVGFSIAWRSLVAAEMIGGDAGIGWLIASSGQIGNSPLVLVGIITIGILSLFIETLLLRPFKKRFADWTPHS